MTPLVGHFVMKYVPPSNRFYGVKVPVSSQSWNLIEPQKKLES